MAHPWKSTSPRCCKNCSAARHRCQLRHRHNLFSLCEKTQTVAKPYLQPLPAGSTVPSRKHPCPAASFISPSQLRSQSTLSYRSQLLLQPTWQRALTHPQGPIPLPPSSSSASLPAHLLMPSSPSYLQLSICKLLLRFCSLWFCSLQSQAPYLIWHPEHPYFIWHLAPPPRGAVVPG